MGRPRKDHEGDLEEKMVKVKRVLGNKVNIFSQFKFFQENPEVYKQIVNYEEVNVPEDTFKEMYGVSLVEDKGDL
jgi:hypothetical protein